MKWLACFLGFLALTAGCVLEDRAVGTGGTGGNGCGTCEDPTPVCNPDSGQCVECTEGQVDFCTAQSLLCDTVRFQCVACVNDSDCTAVDAAKCDPEMKECAPCDSREQCNDVEGLPGNNNACDLDRGVCVDCTPATEADTCLGETSCDPRTFTCTETNVGSLDVCEACVADSECGDNGDPTATYRCVPMTYDGNPFPNDQTGFCLKTTQGACEQPFSIPLVDRSSLSEPTVEANYCGINENLATCPAVKALLENEQCPRGTPEECPQPSGLCERVGVLENRCTYRCGLPAQCPADPPANTCDNSGSEPYCGN